MARAWREHNFPTLDLFGWRQYLKHDEKLPDEEVDLARTRTLSGLRVQEAQPAFLAA